MSERNAISRRAFLGAGALAAVLGAGCSGPGGSGAISKPRHVFLLTLDTLRADHLECHGYPRVTAPFLARLAGEGVRFASCQAASSHTNPCHASLFSGLHLPQHKMFTNAITNLTEGIPWLPSLFQAAGYTTAAFGAVSWLKVFNRGFDHFSYYDLPTDADNETRIPYFTATEMVDKVLAWMEGRKPAEPLFVWLHCFDPHGPLQPPPRLWEHMRFKNPAQRDRMVGFWTERQKKSADCWPWHGDLAQFIEYHHGYDAEIRYLDGELERLHGALGAQGFHDGALWVITADHGQGLGSHRYQAHGELIYEEQILVPLIVHTPGVRRRRVITAPVQHTDLLPTLAEILGAAVPDGPTVQGVSLRSALEGGPPPGTRTLYARRQDRFKSGYTTEWEPGPVYSLREGRWKYIVHEGGADELFDLERDPMELENLVGRGRAEEPGLRGAARAMNAALEAEGAHLTQTGEEDPETEALKALGYLGDTP